MNFPVSNIDVLAQETMLKKEYIIFDNSENHEIQVKKLTSVEKNKLEDCDKLIVEENFTIQGSSTEKTNRKNREKLWNKRMIRVDDNHQDTKEQIKVALIDSGVDYSEDINVKERINLIPEEENVSALYDDTNGHGTAIASIICSSEKENGEAKGIYSNIDLYSIKVLDEMNEAPLSRIIEGINRAIELDVDIISISFGTTKNCDASQITVMPAGMKQTDFKEMKEDLSKMPWDKIWNLYPSLEGYKKNDTNKRFILWGMLMHIETDAFAHRAYKKVDGQWVRVTDTDNINECNIRYKAAGQVVKNIMSQCINTEAPYSSNYFISKQMALSETYYNGKMQLLDLVLHALDNTGNEPAFDSYKVKLAKGTFPGGDHNKGILMSLGLYYN